MYYFKLLSKSDITARTLILSLMSAHGEHQHEISKLMSSGLLFDIEPATIRVAVTRLLKDKMLQSERRGLYSPGPESRALSNQLSGWKDVESKTRTWNGDWLAVHTRQLGRTNRKKLRASIRALNLNGYAEVYPGFSVRPNNLMCSLNEQYKNLISIGLDQNAILTEISDLANPELNDWKTLWSVDALKKSYDHAIQAMATSLSKLGEMDLEAAARETLLVGQSVIQTINLDPLLPNEFGNKRLFQMMLSDMIHYNQIGVDYWNQYRNTT